MGAPSFLGWVCYPPRGFQNLFCCVGVFLSGWGGVFVILFAVFFKIILAPAVEL